VARHKINDLEGISEIHICRRSTTEAARGVLWRRNAYITQQLAQEYGTD